MSNLVDWLDSVCCRGIHSTYDTFGPQSEPISMLPELKEILIRVF